MILADCPIRSGVIIQGDSSVVLSREREVSSCGVAWRNEGEGRVYRLLELLLATGAVALLCAGRALNDAAAWYCSS